MKRNCALVCENILKQFNNLTPYLSGQKSFNLVIFQSLNKKK